MTTTPTSPNNKTAYEKLEERFAEIHLIADIGGILQWDAQTGMPKGAVERRGAQDAFLSTYSHELLVAAEVGAWLDEAEKSPPIDPWQKRNLALMRRSYQHETVVPADLVGRNAMAQARCFHAWETEKHKGPAADFEQVKPFLKDVVACQREIARHKAQALGVSPYEALMDIYEPGRRAADIDRLFAPLEAFLPSFITAVEAKQAAEKKPLPLQPVSKDLQEKVGPALATQMGFDLTHGRIDTSTHPFCGGATDDVRLTTRYDENDPTSSVYGLIHEGGHGQYEQGRPSQWVEQPVGQALGMGVHESQSLIKEMVIGRSKPFVQWLSGHLKQNWGNDPALEPQNLYSLVTHVERSFIRTEADAITYPLHVILRYRIEKDLIEGRLEVDDLPKRWNADMQRLLGITPKNNAEGCMQDMHWYGSAFGYFPSYSLGAMGAAQLYMAAIKQEPAIEADIAKGDFTKISSWLHKNVHSKGSLLPADEMFKAATGAPLQADAFIAFMTERYYPGYVAGPASKSAGANDRNAPPHKKHG